MADLQIILDEEKIQEVLFGDRGMAVLMESVLNEVLQSEMTGHLGAAPEERSQGRRGYRNGSYERELTTRVGTLQLEVPRDRDGTFSTELFDRYQSELAKGLEGQVRAWAERPLGKCPFLICDAMQVKVRRQGAVRSTTVLLAVGVTAEGQREILGLEVAFGETGAAWKRLLIQLKGRGLCGVEVATRRCARWAAPGRRGELPRRNMAALPGTLPAQRTLRPNAGQAQR